MAWELDPELLAVLACPVCHHHPLAFAEVAEPPAATLTCTGCGRVYPIEEGIPVLLPGAALAGSGPQAEQP